MLGFYSGNDMLVRGALHAGCGFFAGYPITPATSILVSMVNEMPKRGRLAIEAEDEIAAIGFCLGAALAGKKAMTAPSGPGTSLYSENIGLAIAAEIPLVIVDVQRHGPATGSATQTAQGDIQFIRWVTAGGMPVVALCPTTAAECFTLAVEAFNFAERLRAPVFIVSDKELALTKERVDLDALVVPEVEERVPAPRGQVETYRFDETAEVPAMTHFDGDRRTRYTTSTHDERGYLTTDTEKIGRFIDHLDRKISARADELERVVWDPQPGARDLIVSYGSTAAAYLIHAARRNIGIKVIVFNNFNFGMTGGQHSATTPEGAFTATTRHGHLEAPLDICATVAPSKPSFVARTSTYHPDFGDMVRDAIAADGFALLDIWELCSAYFGPANTLNKKKMSGWMESFDMPAGVIVRSDRREFAAGMGDLVAEQRADGNGGIRGFDASFASDHSERVSILIAANAG